MPTYGRGFYEGRKAGSSRSAATILPLVFQLIGPPSSVLDVGCGIGTWLCESEALGAGDLVGVDGDYVERTDLGIKASAFVGHDLSQPVDLGRKFDLVMSLEVAEHIDEGTSERFVDTLTRHGDTVLFSAAVPGQGGSFHVNERWPSYWVDGFERNGFEVLDVLRPAIWNDQRIEFWYRQNLLLFASKTRAVGLRRRAEELGLISMPILDVVHPELIEAKSTQRMSPYQAVMQDVNLRARRQVRKALGR